MRNRGYRRGNRWHKKGVEKAHNTGVKNESDKAKNNKQKTHSSSSLLKKEEKRGTSAS